MLSCVKSDDTYRFDLILPAILLNGYWFSAEISTLMLRISTCIQSFEVLRKLKISSIQLILAGTYK